MPVRCDEHPSDGIGNTVTESQIECGVMENVPTWRAQPPSGLTRVSVIWGPILCNCVVSRVTTVTSRPACCARTILKPPVCLTVANSLPKRKTGNKLFMSLPDSLLVCICIAAVVQRIRINWLARSCVCVNTKTSPCPYCLPFAKLNPFNGVPGYENILNTLCVSVCSYPVLTNYCRLS